MLKGLASLSLSLSLKSGFDSGRKRRERGMERERGKMVLFIVFVGSLRDTTLVTTLLPVSTSQERRRGGRGTSGGPVSRAESKESWTEHLVLFHASPFV